MKFRRSNHVDVPNGNCVVWRYLSAWKFERLVKDAALYFPTANTLSDKYEVTIPESSIKAKRNILEAEGYKGKELKEQLAIFNWKANPLKDRVLVNCWSMRRYESYALWKIYLDAAKNGVAIRSTVASVRRAIEGGDDSFPEDFCYAKVRYRNHLHPDDLHRAAVVTTKKKFYDFENEFRIFILRDDTSDVSGSLTEIDGDGRNVRVDLRALIRTVYISPFSDSRYKRNFGQLLRSAGIGLFAIQDSAIRDFN
jgi:hypothetical protein